MVLHLCVCVCVFGRLCVCVYVVWVHLRLAYLHMGVGGVVHVCVYQYGCATCDPGVYVCVCWPPQVRHGAGTGLREVLKCHSAGGGKMVGSTAEQVRHVRPFPSPHLTCPHFPWSPKTPPLLTSPVT